jgi:thioredoxin reductase
MSTDYEALIVGGGAAGLSAALVLGRARVNTLVVDAGEPSNLAAPAIGGLLGQHDTAPGSLYAAGRAQLAELPSVTVTDGTVTGVEQGFAATLAGGESVTAARVLLATGMHYQRPDVPGIEAFWGDSAFHCPYCHGWEHRDGRLAVLGGQGAGHRALLARQWSDDVVVLADDLTDEDRAALDEKGIPVDERPVAGLEGDGARLTAVRFADGDALERDGVLVFAPLRPHDELGPKLGCETTDTPNASGILVTEARGRTTVPGVFAAGDVSATMQQVSLAIAAGSEAAASVHQSLVFGL